MALLKSQENVDEYRRLIKTRPRPKNKQFIESQEDIEKVFPLTKNIVALQTNSWDGTEQLPLIFQQMYQLSLCIWWLDEHHVKQWVEDLQRIVTTFKSRPRYVRLATIVYLAREKAFQVAPLLKSDLIFTLMNTFLNVGDKKLAEHVEELFKVDFIQSNLVLVE